MSVSTGQDARLETMSLVEQLEYLEFSERVAELKAAGRLDYSSEVALADMIANSKNLTEFRSRMRSGQMRALGAVEYRYLSSALEAPLGRRPESWRESAAWVRSFSADPYLNTAATQRAERDRKATMTQNYV